MGVLLREKVIPNEEAMIHSPIQVNFLKQKRKWEFSRIFVIYSHTHDTPRVLHQLNGFGLMDIKSKPLIGYLNEKFVSIIAFTQAKQEVEWYLRSLGSSLEVISVKDIELKGEGFTNKEHIESNLEFEYNFSEAQVVKGEVGSSREPKHHKYPSNILNRTVNIKVVFKIGTIEDL